MTSLLITDHARQRMAQRRLTERHIMAVLDAGSTVLISSHKKRHTLGEIAVVTADSPSGYAHIITVFRRFNTPWSKKPMNHPEKQTRKAGFKNPNIKALLRRGRIDALGGDLC